MRTLDNEDGSQQVPPKSTLCQKIVNILIILIIIGMFLTIFIGMGIENSPIQRFVSAALDWVHSIPPLCGCAVMILIYAIALTIMAPASPFNLASGFLFGLWRGLAVVFCGAFIAQTNAYLISRLAIGDCRPRVEASLRDKPKLLAVVRATANGPNATKLLFLMHLSPLFPSGMLNYAFSVFAPSLTYLQFLIASMLGLAPLTALAVFVGSALDNISQIWSGESDDKTIAIVFLVLAIVSTLLTLALTTWIGKREIDKISSRLEQTSIPIPINDSDQHVSIELEDIDTLDTHKLNRKND
eukprot:TRINITY_DN111_c5_g1_i1.p1 TRINITY_DN111_c5_g1~~TRINITY_DN111_c5_g1_i1.p1  ORF type:complete len:299 (+),score=140.90 TRINITY_DN111_c5_g1_i1:60-956(+)